MMSLHHSKMTHHVVLDADWFVVNKVRHFKAIAFFAPTLGVFGEVTFSLPPGSSIHRRDLLLQARSSHGLDWRTPGHFRHDEVDKALEYVISRLQHPDLEYFAKGSEKCKLLERHLPAVTDLDTVGCPKFEALCEYPRTTLQKAIVFGQWLEWSE